MVTVGTLVAVCRFSEAIDAATVLVEFRSGVGEVLVVDLSLFDDIAYKTIKPAMR